MGPGLPDRRHPHTRSTRTGPPGHHRQRRPLHRDRPRPTGSRRAGACHPASDAAHQTQPTPHGGHHDTPNAHHNKPGHPNDSPDPHDHSPDPRPPTQPVTLTNDHTRSSHDDSSPNDDLHPDTGSANVGDHDSPDTAAEPAVAIPAPGPSSPTGVIRAQPPRAAAPHQHRSRERLPATRRVSAATTGDCGAIRPLLYTRLSYSQLATLGGLVAPGCGVEEVVDPAGVALGAGVFPMTGPVPADAAPDVAGVVVAVRVGDSALVASPDAGAVGVDAKRRALLREGVGVG